MVCSVAGVGAFALANAACSSGDSSGGGASGQPNAIKVVAAENFYGDIAGQLGGSHVSVVSIISDPNVDPHEYESSTSDAKAIADASLVIENGVGYDSFVDKLLDASSNGGRVVINAGDLVGKKAGDNPHIWYDLDWIQQVADDMTAKLTQLDASNRAEYNSRNEQFKASLTPIRDKLSAMKGRYAGARLTQTEDVFGYMGQAIGLKIDYGDFQRAVEAGTDPPPQALAEIDAEISQHQVKAVLYNNQTVSPITDTVKDAAKQSGVPVVGVSETQPASQTYQQWMTSQLDALDKALGG